MYKIFLALGANVGDKEKNIQERDFVLKPLTDLEPGSIHPILKKSIMQLLHELPQENRSIV